MPKRRRDPKILDFTTPQRWISSVGANLNVINPHGAANPHGNCEGCAIHAAWVLVSTTQPALVGPGTAAVGTQFRLMGTFEEDDDRADDIWQALTTRAVPNGVYLLTDDDHTFNMLRDAEGRLYYVDSNQHVYAWVQSAAGCAVLTVGGAPYNPLGPGEDSMEVYYCGQLHKRWR